MKATSYACKSVKVWSHLLFFSPMQLGILHEGEWFSLIDFASG